MASNAVLLAKIIMHLLPLKSLIEINVTQHA